MAMLVKKEHILINLEASNWEDALFKAGQPLVATHDIDPEYLKQTVQSVKDLGPYIVLSPGLALSHAAPSPAVKHSSIAFANFKNDIHFGSPNDPVRLIITLACVDRTSHIEMLSKIAKVLLVEGAVKQLIACHTVDEFFESINSINLNNK